MRRSSAASAFCPNSFNSATISQKHLVSSTTPWGSQRGSQRGSQTTSTGNDQQRHASRNPPIIQPRTQPSQQDSQIHTVEVTGSSPVARTKGPRFRPGFFRFCRVSLTRETGLEPLRARPQLSLSQRPQSALPLGTCRRCAVQPAIAVRDQARATPDVQVQLVRRLIDSRRGPMDRSCWPGARSLPCFGCPLWGLHVCCP